MTQTEAAAGKREWSYTQAFSGHPRGVYLIAVVEVWERFSFYGMRSLLVLFLIAPAATGGFGWSTGEALRFYGAYIALAYLAPIIGGYVADHYLGPRKALVWGAMLMCAGHFLMTGPVLFPWLIGAASGAPLLHYLHAEPGLTFGALTVTQDAGASLDVIIANARANDGVALSPEALQLSYLSISYSFYAAAGLIILGTGFFKPNTYAVLGRLYKDQDPQRENGVFLYQISVNLGAIFSALIAGTLGERYGWHYGFSAAGVGMAIGAIIFCWKQNQYLGEIDHTPPAKKYKAEAAAPVKMTAVERRRLMLIAVMGVFSGLYWLAAEQSGGSINIYALQSTDRDVFGFEIPATWFQSLNPFFVVLLTPLAMIVWHRLGTRVNQAQKFGIGFIFTAVGFFLMTGAFLQAASAPDGKSAALWLVGAYLFVTLGELCINSVGLNLVNTYAPMRMIGSVLAFWFLCTAIANYGSGLVGALTETIPDGAVFAGIAVVCLTASAALFVGSIWWSSFIHEGEGRRQ